MFLVGKPTFKLLERSLDAASLRQNVIANNIANVDTPYFKRSDVKFEELLQQQMNGALPFTGKRTDPRHFAFGGEVTGGPQIVTDPHSVINNNNNNIDIDSEMAAMAKNQLRYDVMIQQLNKQFKDARTAIDGRR